MAVGYSDAGAETPRGKHPVPALHPALAGQYETHLLFRLDTAPRYAQPAGIKKLWVKLGAVC